MAIEKNEGEVERWIAGKLNRCLKIMSNNNRSIKVETAKFFKMADVITIFDLFGK